VPSFLKLLSANLLVVNISAAARHVHSFDADTVSNYSTNLLRSLTCRLDRSVHAKSWDRRLGALVAAVLLPGRRVWERTDELTALDGSRARGRGLKG